MIVEDDSDILASEDDKSIKSEKPVRINHLDDVSSEEDQIGRHRKRSGSEKYVPELGMFDSPLSQAVPFGSSLFQAGVGVYPGQMGEVKHKRIEGTVPPSDPSTFAIDKTPRLRQRVKLRRDRLLDVEHASERCKAIFDQNQLSSPLLRLPWEIRHQIYQLALGGQRIHIDYKPHVHKWRQKNHQQFKVHIPGGLYSRVIEEHDGGDDNSRHLLRHRALSLVGRTCRQVYQETTLLQYSLNKFSFGNCWVMERWIKSLQPVQRRAITHLVLPDNLDIEKYILNDLRGLRKVFLRCSENPSERETLRKAEIAALWESRGALVVYNAHKTGLGRVPGHAARGHVDHWVEGAEGGHWTCFVY